MQLWVTFLFGWWVGCVLGVGNAKKEGWAEAASGTFVLLTLGTVLYAVARTMGAPLP